MKHRRARTRVSPRPKGVILRSKFKRERRRRAVKWGGILALTGLLAFGGWQAWLAVSRYVLSAPCFTIRTIEIRGLHNVTESEIVALLPFRSGDNIFKAWLAGAEENLRQCKPELKSVSLHRRWKKVLIEVAERYPVACVQQDGTRMGVDGDNAVFPLRGQLFRKAFPEIVAKNRFERKDVLEFIRLLQPKSRELFSQVVRFYPEPVHDVVLELSSGMRVYWGEMDAETLEPKLQRLNQVLADARNRFSSIEYVNLCYFKDGRILVKPAPQGLPAPQASAPTAGTAARDPLNRRAQTMFNVERKPNV